MSTTAIYSATELLRDGREVEIRALEPADQDALIAAVHRASSRSLYLRFFSAKRDFSDNEIAYFLNVDFTDHVALVVTVEEGGRAVSARC